MLKKFDDKIRSTGNFRLICGIDEAGRGPLAGPVVAAAVIFPPEVKIIGVDDSKKINAKLREELFQQITDKCIAYGVGIVDPQKIDEINILQATLLAMKNALNNLNVEPDLVIIDGNKSFAVEYPVQTIIGGDAKSFSIAAASIVAKVTRDRIMRNYHSEFPVYNWIQNKGYGTKEHIRQILLNGKSKYHRETFLKNIYKKNSLL